MSTSVIIRSLAICKDLICAVPGPVSGLSTTPEVLQLTILWNLPSEPNGRITAYQIRYRIGEDREINSIDTSATRHTLEGFKPNTVATFSITAYTIEGPGENVTFQTSTGSVRELREYLTACSYNYFLQH